MPWLRGWQAADAVPESALEQLPAAVAIADRACQSASDKALGVAMGRLIGWIGRAGLYRFSDDPAAARREAAEITQDYAAGLSDLPEDLLIQAVNGIIGTHRYRNLPMAGDIRALVEEELSRRRNLQRSLRSAQFVALKLKRVEPGPYRVERTPEQIAAAAAMAAAVKAVSVEVRPVPAQRDDVKPEPTEDRKATVQRVLAETAGFRRVPKPGERKAGDANATAENPARGCDETALG